MKKLHFYFGRWWLSPLFISFLLSSCKEDRPNIIVIMCDDMGFSDISCYGGEINTPNLDQLADEGIRFTQFKNTSRSCPSRASLITGCYPHTVGMGWMTAVDEHRPGYRGQLLKSHATIAEEMKEGGYSTYMSGKWHLTLDPVFQKTDTIRSNGSFPLDRGFDHYFGSLAGGISSYYSPEALMEDNKQIRKVKEDFYYTDAISEHAVDYIRQHDKNGPLFMYIAHFAPHWPLNAPEERVARCRERYKVGYDVLRQQRFDRQLKMGIVPAGEEVPRHFTEFPKGRKPWEELNGEKKQAWIENMAIYAAMVEIMDDGIGRVMDALKEEGMYDNTVILFLSDNGCGIFPEIAGQEMADLCNTPYRHYKGFEYMGGISSPLIVHYPERYKEMAGQIRHQTAHIMDIMPTCLDWAGLKPRSCEGISLRSVIEDNAPLDRPLFFEHMSSCGMISGHWKLGKAQGDDLWQLFDLKSDPYETKDVASSHPEVLKMLTKQWDQWAEEHNVLPLDARKWFPRINFYTKQNPDQDGID